MEDEENHLKILAVDNGSASRKWRFDGQASRINKFTKHEMFVTSYKNWNGDIAGANLVVLEMLTGERIVEECHRQGAKVIYEADDAVIDTYGRERKTLQHIGPAWRASSIDTIRMCDALTVSKESLKANYARFTKNPIYVLPFYVDFDWYGHGQFLTQRITDEIRVGWFGGFSHHEDLKMIAPIMKQILEKYPKVKFIYCGYGGMSSDRLMTEVGWGEDVLKIIPRERREFVVGVGEQFWPEKHRTLDLDIAISPLISDKFNECKTYTKWLEFSALKTPGVYSELVYSDVVKHGKTGFLAKTPEEWIKYLSLLIEDKQLRKKMGEDAHRKVLRDFDLDSKWTKWVDIYSQVVGI